MSITPDRMKAIRLRLGLTQAEMAERFRLGKNGGRTIRRYESGQTQPSGPVALLYETFETEALERSDGITTKETRHAQK